MKRVPITYAEIGHVRPLELIERDVIEYALKYYGTKEEAAAHLGIARSTIYRKLAKVEKSRADQ